MGHKEIILEFISRQDYPVSTYTIAKKTGINANSVRARLSEMVASGLLVREYLGHYSINPIHGVGATTRLPKLQNITAIVHPTPKITKNNLIRGEKLGYLIRKGNQFHHRFEIPGIPSGKEGIMSIDLCFGVKRNKITWRMKVPLGLDYNGLMLSYSYIADKINTLGYSFSEENTDFDSPNGFQIVNIEWLEEICGIKLEGVNCITFSDLKGELEKVYNKAYGVRREIRSIQPRPLSEIFALYTGGMPSFMLAQSSYDIARSVDRLAEAQKYSNRTLSDLVNQGNQNMDLHFEEINLLKEMVRKLL